MTGLKRKKGFLIVLSGPSGAGKNTVVNELSERLDGVRYSVSVTTRPPGPGEIDGVHYKFLTHDEFRKMQEAGNSWSGQRYTAIYTVLHAVSSKKLLRKGMM